VSSTSMYRDSGVSLTPTPTLEVLRRTSTGRPSHVGQASTAGGAQSTLLELS
jgi:hypothetical protein